MSLGDHRSRSHPRPLGMCPPTRYPSRRSIDCGGTVDPTVPRPYTSAGRRAGRERDDRNTGCDGEEERPAEESAELAAAGGLVRQAKEPGRLAEPGTRVVVVSASHPSAVDGAVGLAHRHRPLPGVSPSDLVRVRSIVVTLYSDCPPAEAPSGTSQTVTGWSVDSRSSPPSRRRGVRQSVEAELAEVDIVPHPGSGRGGRTYSAWLKGAEPA